MSETQKQTPFGRGFADVIFGRLTTNEKPSISTDQLIVTAGTAIGSFFLGKNPIARAVLRARTRQTRVDSTETAEVVDA